MFGTRAGFFVDLFGLLFVLILPAIFFAVTLVRRGKVKAHASIMWTSFFIFLTAVLAFEIDVHTSDSEFNVPLWVLGIHLCFALPCLGLWLWLTMACSKSQVLWQRGLLRLPKKIQERLW